jgi:hypothetical protein
MNKMRSLVHCYRIGGLRLNLCHYKILELALNFVHFASGKITVLKTGTFFAMKMYGGVEVNLQTFLTSEVDGGDGRLHTQPRSTPVPIGQNVGPEPQSLSGRGSPWRESNTSRPAHSLVTVLIELPWLPHLRKPSNNSVQ